MPIAPLTLLLLAGSAAIAERELDRRVLAMGTELSLHLEGSDAQVLAAGSQDAIAEVDRIERACSTWRADSAWSRLNLAGGSAVRLDGEWITLLHVALEWSRQSQGAFDPVLGALIQAWGIRQGGRTPTEAELRTARADSGARLLQLDARAGTARLRRPHAAIEEGGFVKGYALDRARARLEAAGVRDGWLDFGGQLLAWGRPRKVELASPTGRRTPLVRLSLAQASLSTSGASERGRHIVDPRTGARSPDWGSVSVVAADGLTADVLSLVLYVLGPERGPRWANQHQVSALFLSNSGAVIPTRTFPPYTLLGPVGLAAAP